MRKVTGCIAVRWRNQRIGYLNDRQLTGLVDTVSSIMDIPNIGGVPKSFVDCFKNFFLPIFYLFQHITVSLAGPKEKGNSIRQTKP